MEVGVPHGGEQSHFADSGVERDQDDQPVQLASGTYAPSTEQLTPVQLLLRAQTLEAFAGNSTDLDEAERLMAEAAYLREQANIK